MDIPIEIIKIIFDYIKIPKIFKNFENFNGKNDIKTSFLTECFKCNGIFCLKCSNVFLNKFL